MEAKVAYCFVDHLIVALFLLYGVVEIVRREEMTSSASTHLALVSHFTAGVSLKDEKRKFRFVLGKKPIML